MQQPGLAALDQMTDLGAESRQLHYPFRAATQPASQPTSAPASKQWHPFNFPRHWPSITIYALPPVVGIQ